MNKKMGDKRSLSHTCLTCTCNEDAHGPGQSSPIATDPPKFWEPVTGDCKIKGEVVGATSNVNLTSISTGQSSKNDDDDVVVDDDDDDDDDVDDVDVDGDIHVAEDPWLPRVVSYVAKIKPEVEEPRPSGSGSDPAAIANTSSYTKEDRDALNGVFATDLLNVLNACTQMHYKRYGHTTQMNEFTFANAMNAYLDGGGDINIANIYESARILSNSSHSYLNNLLDKNIVYFKRAKDTRDASVLTDPIIILKGSDDDEGLIVTCDKVLKKDDDPTVAYGAVPRKDDDPAVACKGVPKEIDDTAVGYGAVPKKEDDSAVAYDAVSEKIDDTAVAYGAVPKEDDDLAVAYGAVSKKVDDTATAYGAVPKKDDDPAVAYGVVPKKDDDPAATYDAISKNVDDTAIAYGAVPKKDDDPAIAYGAVPKKVDDSAVAYGAVPKKVDDSAVAHGAVPKKVDVSAVAHGAVPKKADDTAVSYGAIPKKVKEPVPCAKVTRRNNVTIMYDVFPKGTTYPKTRKNH